MVNTALGTHVGTPSQQSVGSDVLVCTYLPASATGIGEVILRVQQGVDATTFASDRASSDHNGLPTSDLPGFEDHAYTSVINAGAIVTNTVCALKGRLEVQLSSSATFEQEKTFIVQVYARLGMA
jgi:hypothetical protein